MEILRSEVQNGYHYDPDSWNLSRFLKNVIEFEENQLAKPLI